MKRKRAKMSAAVIAVLAFAGLTAGTVLSSASTVEGDVVVLKFADTYSATHPIGEAGAQPFLEYLQENGPEVGLQIEYFGNGQMGSGYNMPALLRNDVVQLAPLTPSGVSSQLPLSSVSELPGLVDDACVGSEALLELMQEGGSIYEHELKDVGVRPLWVAFVTDYELMTAGTPIESPDDIAGTLIRSNGGIADRVVKNLGAGAVALPGPDMYEALSRGTVTGAAFPPVSTLAYNLEEVLTHSTVGAQLGLSNTTYAISTQAWERLNEEQREVVTEASELANGNACQVLPAAATAALHEMEEAGVELVEVQDETRQAWYEALQPVRDEWVADVEAAGSPAELVLQDYERALEEAAQ